MVALEATTSKVDWSTLTSAITSSMSTADILSIIAIIITAGIGFVLVWFGARKIAKAVIGAFQSGKIKF